jgi:hypothetical protein
MIYSCISYFISNLSGGVTLMAENNYWNNPVSPYGPKANKIYGSVDSNPALEGGGSSYIFSLEPDPDGGKRLPSVYALGDNYPNPFNPTTAIRYDVPPSGGVVRIAVYNVRGQLVRTLVDEVKAAGYHAAEWDGLNADGQRVSSGVYFVQMTARQFVKNRKLVLLK